MNNSKTMETLLNRLPFKAIRFTKFCYFFLVLLLISCGNNKNKQSSEISEVETKEAVENERLNNDTKTILFFGDSITAGYGLDDVNDAYPALIQQKIDSLDVKYEVVNSGVSGETTAGGRSRIDWILNQDIDVFVLELGANDGLRGVPLTETRANLQAIIDAVRAKSPNTKIVLAGMQLPPNFGQAYTNDFKAIFPELAAKNDTALIPFILEDVGGIASLNQADGIHPTVEGHQIVTETVWEVLRNVVVY